MKYKEALKQLFPKGRLWTFPSGGTLDKLIEGVAEELLRVEQRAIQLLSEIDPRTTTEAISDWERVLGLPGECATLATTNEERRQQILSKLLQTGPQNKTFFVEIAQGLGYDITISDITTFDPFRVEVSRVESNLNEASAGWVHAFQINVNEVTLRPFRVETHTVEERLLEFGDELLECVIEQVKEAHATVIFSYPD
jgi:uncharacterized protein YmfQ (DUF2313 family)